MWCGRRPLFGIRAAGSAHGVAVRKPERTARFLLLEGACLLAASIDEGIQLFSEGRGVSFRDVCIDLSGATLGVLIALLTLMIVRHIGIR